MADVPISQPSPQAAARRGSVVARATDALPSPSLVIFGSAAWGIIVAITTMAGMWLRNEMISANLLAIASVYFYGGSLAFAPGLWLGEFLFGRAGRALRFFGGTLVIALAVHTATSGIFALQYRVFYSHWHNSFPSVVWFFQFGFTTVGGVFTFTVGSLAFYWPFSCLAFLGFGLWFSRRGAKAH